MKLACAADLDEEQALIEAQANVRQEIDVTKSIDRLNNLRTTTAPTTTTAQAATTSKAKNCRALIQKRAHTLDDFMEGKRMWIKRQPYYKLIQT